LGQIPGTGFLVGHPPFFPFDLLGVVFFSGELVTPFLSMLLVTQPAPRKEAILTALVLVELGQPFSLGTFGANFGQNKCF
jgi:hypothetical protein